MRHQPKRQTLRAARQKAELSVDQLAELSGVHRSTIFRLEGNDYGSPSHLTVVNLERALGLAPGTLEFPRVEQPHA